MENRLTAKTVAQPDERHVLGVAQGAVRLRLAFLLAALADHDPALLVSQGALDGDGAIAEGRVWENARERRELDLAGLGRSRRLLALYDDRPSDLLALRVEQGCKLRLDERAEQPRHIGDLLLAHLLALRAEALAHLPPEARRVDELHLALALRGLAVRHDPDIGRNAGVVEHVGRQADDRLHKIVFQHVAPDFAFARSRAAGEERRAVEHDAEARAAVRRRAHLREQVHQKQHRAVRHARQAWPETAAKP